jgi:hypothetical protein
LKLYIYYIESALNIKKGLSIIYFEEECMGRKYGAKSEKKRE